MHFWKEEEVMLTCPECFKSLSIPDSLACEACGWIGSKHEDIPDYLTAHEMEDPIFREYLKNYDDIAEEDLKEGILDERYVKNQAFNLAEFLGPIRGCKLAEIGSGKGYLVAELVKRGANRVTAIDIALPYLMRLRGQPSVDPVRANAENLPFGNEFDVVVSTDVMEHVLNLGSFLYSVNRSLKRGGRLCIRVPYRENLLGYSPHLGCRFKLVHLRVFDKSILADCMEHAGFVVKEFSLDGFGLGMPRRFWTRGGFRAELYDLIKKWVESRLEHPADVAFWKSWYAGFLMRATTVSVKASKKFDIQPKRGGGFELMKA
jgi:SAM-dependent methyltransferase